MTTITRFAPSPTGPLHLGSAYAALVAWRRARDAGGRFLVRIEDIDPVRCRPDHARAMLDDLMWLGLEWDGPVRVQGEHWAEYRGVLDNLGGRGLLYPCFCTRADIAAAVAAPHGPDGAPLYPGTCRALSAAERADRLARGEPAALRLDMARAAHECGALARREEGKGDVPCNPAAFGDVVLARKDVPGSYHLCVTHDDAVQGVTLVTRAADLESVTDLHRLLQALMGWPAPHYAHHSLLLDAAGRRLSKRDGSTAISYLRRSGLTRQQVLALASPAVISRAPACRS